MVQYPTKLKQHAFVMIQDQFSFLQTMHVNYAQQTQHLMPMILTASVLQDIENRMAIVYQTAQLMLLLMPQARVCAQVANFGEIINAINHQCAQTDLHSTHKHYRVYAMIGDKIL